MPVFIVIRRADSLVLAAAGSQSGAKSEIKPERDYDFAGFAEIIFISSRKKLLL